MFSLPELPYDYAALQPVISRDIMDIHHSKHHAGYVNKLNSAVEQAGGAIVADMTLEAVLRHIDSLPEGVREAVRNQGGGHYNHSLFWQCMTAHGNGQPTGELLASLEQRYGSFQAFVDQFSAQAAGVFGSGWAWLMPDLSITTSPNQDNPVMFGHAEPLMGLDVWEHAYYLDYKNVRADYIAAWWEIVNWEFIEQRFQHIAPQPVS